MSILRISSLLAILLTCSMAQAQTTKNGNSPYTRLGLGSPYPQGVAALQHMGSPFGGYRSYYHLNMNNPASLSALRFTSFEVGGFYDAAYVKDNESGATGQSHAGNLGYLLIGAPVTRHWEGASSDTLLKVNPVQWGMAFGVQPQSRIAYNVQQVNTDSAIGQTTTSYYGSGNFHQLSWSNGVSYKNTSFGLTLGYYFGRSNRNTLLEFDDASLSNAYYSRLKESENLKGFVWNAGVQHTFVFDKKKEGEDPMSFNKRPNRRLTIGAYGHSAHKINNLQNRQFERINLYLGLDTIQSATEVKTKTTLPATFGFGLNFSRSYNYNFGLNVEYSQWSQYSAETANTLSVSAGMEWTPQFDEMKNYMKRVNYRLGVFYNQDPRLVESAAGETYQLTKYGMAFGLGLPIIQKAKPSFVNLGVEIGQLGHSKLIRETYFRITAGFTLNDTGWFVRPKLR